MIYKIEAIIQPFKLADVRRALEDIGIEGMTITELRGHGRQKGHTETYRGREYKVDLLPKARVEVVAQASRKDEIVSTIVAAARTGQIGDGKIFIQPVLTAIRIRNDDRDELAL